MFLARVTRFLFALALPLPAATFPTTAPRLPLLLRQTRFLIYTCLPIQFTFLRGFCGMLSTRGDEVFLFDMPLLYSARLACVLCAGRSEQGRKKALTISIFSPL